MLIIFCHRNYVVTESAQQVLLSLIEKWKNILGKKGYRGAVLMDLSKPLDTINHYL